jgi:hypothetical protein
VAAIVYSAALIVAGFVMPVYSSESVSSEGEITQGSATLVGENGASAVVVLAIPLVIAVVVGVALRRRTRRSVAVAWTLVGLLAAFNLLSIASIGLFVLPVTLALVAALLAQRPRPPSAFARN